MRVLPAACVLIALAWAGTSAAAPRVGIACEEPSRDSSKARLVEELQAVGFDVTEADEDERPSSGSGLSAVLTVRARRIHVRVAQKDGTRYELREAEISLGSTQEEAATATLRAVEFLRASLIEVGSAPPPPTRDRHHTEQPAQHGPLRNSSKAGQRRQPQPGIAFGLGGGIVRGSGKMPVNATFVPALAFPFSHAFGLRMAVVVPVSSSKVERNEGQAALSPTFFALSGTWTPLRWNWATPYLELGAGAGSLAMTGQAAPGTGTQNISTAIGLPFAGAGVSLQPGRLRLRVGGLAGPGFKREHIRFNGNDAAVWGTWIAAVNVSLEVELGQ